MPSMPPTDHHRDELACPPSRATHEGWWRPSGEPDSVTSDLPQSGARYIKDYDVERYWREARLFRIAPISQEMILNYVGEHVLGLPKSY
jgi:alkylation response protein AidB-like acyl-CoA dehydrogenase